MTQDVKQDRLVILSKGLGARFEKEFFLQIQEAFLDGYRIAETDLRDDVSMRNYRGRQGRAVMYKEGTAPDKWTPAKVETTEEPVKGPAPIVKEDNDSNVATGAAENKPLTSLEELETLDKVKDLKEFAGKVKVEIPKTAKSKAEIKEAIKEALEA